MGFWSDFKSVFADEAIPTAVSIALPAILPSVAPAISSFTSTPVGRAVTHGASRLAGEYAGSKLGGKEFDLKNAGTRAAIQAGTTYLMTPSDAYKDTTLGEELGYGYNKDTGNIFAKGGELSDGAFSSQKFAETANLIPGASTLREGLVDVPFGTALGAVAPSVIAPFFESPETQSIPLASNNEQFAPAQGTSAAVALPSTGEVTPNVNVIEATNITTDVPSLPSGVTLGDQESGFGSFLVRDRVTGQQRRVSGGRDFAQRLSRRAAGGFG